ncbi:hypothetical protein MVQ41_001192 [Salmonella enterica]|nr:hypothetical protein [Salmonella enterica]EBF4153832.1 hypothetical protein [Salmonella enterica subsp. enterica serovar Newport]EBF4367270.1 hypothetical protein [Salmonella enterica subsp. enterica serovar Kentucky]EDG6880357.1 hypothetical protein [Salmonella enterica subsp. enterica serovar Enteritidis]EEC6458555.1 hypothetical protein [Salmonella enterica subsp. enterica serovar 4,[5],12:i:-]EEE1696474.1 hypothetical protein [Salmonella enterica subsp. enterica serovar Braenderup]EEN9
MTALNTLTDEAISHAFKGTNFGRNDLKNILAETVIDAAAGWRCGHTATTICTQLGLLTPKGRASALGLRFISEHVQRETKRLKDELESAEHRIAELEARTVKLPEALIPAIHNSGEPFMRPEPFGLYLNRDDVLMALRAAGIGVKGE